MIQIKNKVRWLFLLVILINIVIRVPTSPHEQGIDSFYIHSLSNFITDNAFAKWIINPLSLFGLYPYSYPSMVPFILAVISLITNIKLEFTILLFSIFTGLIGISSIYLFVREYDKNNHNLIFFTIFIFSLSPIFLNFTNWTISTRALFVALLPLVFYSMLKYEKTKKVRFLILLSLLVLIELMIHRMGILILIVILPCYFLSELYLKLDARFNFNKKYFFILIALLVTGLFFLQFSNMEPYKSYKWTYRTGQFFNAGGISDYRAGTLNNLEIFFNMVIDYVSSMGILFLFIPLGVFYLFSKISQNNKFSDIFILFILISSMALLMNGTYTTLFYLPIFSLLSAKGLTIFVDKLKSKKVLYSILPALLITSLIFSGFMNYHWINAFQQGTLSAWIEDSTLSSINFMNLVNKEKGSILVSDNLLNQRIRAFTNLPLLPADKREDEGLFIYNLVGSKDFQIDFSLSYLATSTKSFVRIKEKPIDSEKDWEQIIARDIYSTKKIRNFYNVCYVLEQKNAYYIRDHWNFYKDLKQTQPKIYDNNNEEIWVLQNV